MAAEDFTGPLVLNDQSKLSLAGRVSDATPVSGGAPRYMGQSAATPTKGSANNKPVQRARIIPGDGANSRATLNRLPGLGKLAISAVCAGRAEGLISAFTKRFGLRWVRVRAHTALGMSA